MGLVSPELWRILSCVTFLLAQKGGEAIASSQSGVMAKKPKNPKSFALQGQRLARGIFGPAHFYWLVLRTSL
jgi:hypothetical protein